MQQTRGFEVKRLLLAIVCCLALGACSDEPDVKPATGDDAAPSVVDSSSPAANPSESTDADLPTEDDLQTYFEGTGGQNPAALEASRKLAEEGSVAHAFAGYLLERANAVVDGGGSTQTDETVEKVDGGYEICRTGDTETTCQLMADIEGRDGKIVSFTIDGTPINNRISVGSGKPVRAADIGSAEMLYAYRTVSTGDLLVVIRLRSNADAMSAGLFEATYRAPTGRQSTAADMIGNTELGPNSTSTAVLIFTGAELGGEVRLNFYSNDYQNEAEVVLATK